MTRKNKYRHMEKRNILFYNVLSFLMCFDAQFGLLRNKSLQHCLVKCFKSFKFEGLNRSQQILVGLNKATASRSEQSVVKFLHLTSVNISDKTFICNYAFAMSYLQTEDKNQPYTYKGKFIKLNFNLYHQGFIYDMQKRQTTNL